MTYSRTNREPAIPPIQSQGRHPATGEPLVYYELNTRPDHRVLEIAVMPTGPELAALHMHRTDPFPHIRTVQMMCEEWNVTVDNTRVRWWSWKPRDDFWPPERWAAIRRALAYAEKVKEYIKHTQGVIDRGELPDPAAYYSFGIQDIVNWLKIVIEDLEQIAGEP